MFWKRLDPKQPDQASDDLRAYLTDRLRGALDFATLGAYDLGAIEARGSSHRRMLAGQGPAVACGRKTGGSGRHSPPPHASGASACPIGQSQQRLAPCSWTAAGGSSRPGLASERRQRLSRRAGTAPVPPQPCSW